MNPTKLKRLAGRFGFMIERKTDFGRLLKQHHIDTVLDVGANIGQTYDWLRDCGYDGAIVSLEPDPINFTLLKRKPGANWIKHKLAASDKENWREFYRSDNAAASSIHYPTTATGIRQMDPIKTIRLDTLPVAQSAKNIFLKIDVEGHGHQALDGASGILSKTPLIMLETALKPIFENEPLLADDIGKLNALGYRVIAIERCGFDLAEGLPERYDLIAKRI